MRYIIFILLILSIVFIYFYYNKKIELLKKQLFITRNQYSIIKNKYGYQKKVSENLLVKFSVPKYKGGTLKSNSILYISPITNSNILARINNDTEVGILDCAEFNNETWFYINIPNKSNINNRGWVNSKDISIFFSSSSIYKAN
ncbi:MAG: hypothetical protein HUJ77_05800 [Clostridium sp.]|uniref:hypothetical protein n=1 Tax=Clostridium sp. TaxID=1506 RepID=UPI0025BFD5A0|nr:hypothetical protein [Clostridium sp.]MCF0147896.1 hypothetical protein [Clostridium sp.]